jgi:hypothetical protein
MQAVDTFFNGIKIGHHAAKPTAVDPVHTGFFGSFFNTFLRLSLSPDKKNIPTVGNDINYDFISRAIEFYRLLEVDDVNSVTSPKDVFFHFRVPAFGLMSEVDTGFQQLAHCYHSHVYYSFIKDVGLTSTFFIHTPTGPPGTMASAAWFKSVQPKQESVRF